MQEFKTALGRYVSIDEHQTILEDMILRLLIDYRTSPQNPNNVPMKLSTIVYAVNADAQIVVTALDTLKEDQPPKVEEREKFQQERTFSITDSGMRFVRNIPQDFAGAG